MSQASIKLHFHTQHVSVSSYYRQLLCSPFCPHIGQRVCEILFSILELVVERASRNTSPSRGHPPKGGPDVTAGHPTHHIATYVLLKGSQR